MTRVYKIGQDTFDEGDPEEALKAIGVAVRDASGEFRNINDVLTNLDKVWGKLTQTEKIATAQVVAGVHQYDKFVSLMNNFNTATEATATAMDSAGSATKENEIYLQSIEGRMKSLEATMDGFWTNLIDSDLIRGGVDLLQLLANGLTNVQDAFGTTGLALGTLTATFGIFSPSMRTLAEDFVEQKVTLGGLRQTYEKFKYELTQTNGAMTVAQKGTVSLKAGFQTLSSAIFTTQLKAIALQAVLSLTLGGAITVVVGLLSNMWKGLTDVEGRLEAVGEASEKLGTTLESTTNYGVDLKSYEELRKKLENTNLTAEERTKKELELEEVKKRLYEIDDQAYAILNNQNLSLERQLELLGNINKEKLKESAEELDKKMTGGFWGEDEESRVKRIKETAEYSVQAYKELSELQKQYNGESFEFKGQIISLERQNELLGIYKEQIEKGVLEVDKYNSKVELMKEANHDTERGLLSISSSLKVMYDNFKNATEAIDENTQAKKDNAGVDLGDSGVSGEEVAKLTEGYSQALSSLQSIYDLSEEINKATAMTPDLVSQTTKLFPEIGAKVADVASVQEYLNQKIAEQKKVAEEAYVALIQSDKEYYAMKLQEDENWLNSFRESINQGNNSQVDGYNLDLSNFRKYILDKASMNDTTIDALAVWLQNLIGGNKDAYKTDLANTRNWAQTKALILKKLDEQIKKVESRMANHLTNIKNSSGINDADSLIDEKLYIRANEELKKLETAKTNIETDFSNIGASFFDWANNLKGVGSSLAGHGVGSSNKDKNSSSSKKEQESYKATLEQWYTLKDAIQDVSNAIEENQILRARASGTAKEQEYIKKEVNLLKQQISLNKKLQKEMEKKRNELKSFIMAQGGVFKGENLTNYDKLLGWTATTDAGKEKLKQLEEAVKSYTDLCNSEIPGVKKEWQGLQDQIDELLGTYERYKVDTEQWFALKDQINDVSVAIERYEYLRSKATSDKQEKEYIEKQIELLQQQIVLKKKLQAEMEKEKNQLKALIQASGGKFSGNNLTNYEALFGKEAVGNVAVEKLKELEEAFKRYMELTNTELPDIIMEWEKLQDQIDEVKNSQEKYTASVEKWYKLKDAIQDVNNELEINKVKQEQAVGKDKIELMNKEIALYNKQIELNKQLQKEMEKEKNELKKFIQENGGVFQGDNLTNYDDLFGKEVVGPEAVEALKKLEEAVKNYTDLTNSEIPGIIKQWESLNQEIEKVKEQQINMAINFEKDLYDVLAHYAKKENDLRKKDIENEKKAVEEKKKLLEERRKLLQETFDKEDREDAVAEAQQTLNELDAQIQEALRSGDKELVKRLREQYAEAQKSLNQQIRDQERENALDEFDKISESYDEEIEDLDDLIEELDKKLEEYLDPANISKVIASAMNSGFVNIMGQTVEVNKVMSDFLKETTTGVYTTKEALKELEEQLKNIGAVANQLPGIADSLGIPDYTSSSLTGRSAEIRSSQLVLNSPLVNIESLDNNSIDEFNNIMNEKINWLISQINDKFNY